MDEYNRILKELNTDYIAGSVIEKNYGKSIDDIYNLIQMAYIDYTSYNWFSGDVIFVYPKINEVKARKPYTTIYGAHIGLSSLYINYQALLVNVSKKTKYVLKKPLRFEIGDDLPTNILELEDLERKADIQIPIMRLNRKFKVVK